MGRGYDKIAQTVKVVTMHEIDAYRSPIINKARLIELHKSAFNDGDFYAKFFFENRFESKWAWFTECDGKIVSAVYARPFSLKLFGKVLEVPFFTGIATDSAYRKQGLARRTIEKAIAELKLEGAPFVILHPFLHDFYRNLDFETVSFVNTHKVIYDKNVHTNYRNLTIEDSAIVTELYAKKIAPYSAVRVRDEREVKMLITEHLGDQGEAFVVLNDNIHIGYVLSDTEGIREAIVPDYTLLNGIKELDGESYFYHENGVKEHTMARVVNVEKLFEIAPYRSGVSGEYSFNFDDKNYLLKVENGAFVSITESNVPSPKISAKELIQTVLGQSKKYNNPFTSVFSECNLVIYEKY